MPWNRSAAQHGTRRERSANCELTWIYGLDFGCIWRNKLHKSANQKKKKTGYCNDVKSASLCVVWLFFFFSCSNVWRSDRPLASPPPKLWLIPTSWRTQVTRHRRNNHHSFQSPVLPFITSYRPASWETVSRFMEIIVVAHNGKTSTIYVDTISEIRMH